MTPKNKRGLGAAIIVILIVVIVGAAIGVYFTVASVNQQKALAKTSSYCEDEGIMFDLTSCEFEKVSGVNETTVEFARTDSSGANLQKLFVLISTSKNPKLKEISANLGGNQEATVSVQATPESFYLIGTLDGNTNCRTTEIFCTQKAATGQFVNNTSGAGNESENASEDNSQQEEEQQETPEEVSLTDQIENAIEAALE